MSDPPGERLERRAILLLSTATMAVLTGLACGIVWLWGHPDGGPFARGRGAVEQVLSGIGIGAAVAFLLALVEPRFAIFDELRAFVREVFERVRPTRTDMLLVSLGAGWSEELLFRGAIQPHLGIWPAAVLFGLGHFLLTRLTWGRVLYTAGLILAGAGLGWLAESRGLIAAMVCHAAYDFAAMLLAERDVRNAGIPPR